MSKCMIERLIICSKLSHFYVLRPKTVRFPNQKHTVSVPKPYVLGTENIKRIGLQSKKGFAEKAFISNIRYKLYPQLYKGISDKLANFASENKKRN